MSAFNSSIPSVLFGHNATVKAWCLSGREYSATTTQDAFDAVNFIDGYNLRLNLETQTTGGIGVAAISNALLESGALKFSFITPMVDTKYKVFLQLYRDSSDTSAAGLYNTTFAHVLNSSKFPKTKEYFWIRTGVVRTGGGGSGEIGRVLGSRTGIFATSFTRVNIGVVVL